MQRLTRDRPKSFLEVGGRRLIDHHLEALAARGVTAVHIVVGYLADTFRASLGRRYRGVPIHYVENREYESTGHSQSLFLGRPLFADHAVLLVHADVLCDPVLLDRLIESRRDNVILADRGYEARTGDEFSVRGAGGVVTGIERGSAEDDRGEYVGLGVFAPPFLEEYCAYSERFFARHGRGHNYEVVLNRFLRDGATGLHYEDTDGRRWVNVNYEDDLERARKAADELYG